MNKNPHSMDKEDFEILTTAIHANDHSKQLWKEFSHPMDKVDFEILTTAIHANLTVGIAK